MKGNDFNDYEFTKLLRNGKNIAAGDYLRKKGSKITQLSCNPIRSLQGITVLSEAICDSNITALGLDITRIGTSDLLAFSPALSGNSKIRKLSLSDNNMYYPEVITTLGRLIKVSQVEELNLSYNQIYSYDALNALNIALQGSKVYKLDICYNGISDGSGIIKLLMDNPQITDIELRGFSFSSHRKNEISQSDMQKINRQLEQNRELAKQAAEKPVPLQLSVYDQRIAELEKKLAQVEEKAAAILKENGNDKHEAMESAAKKNEQDVVYHFITRDGGNRNVAIRAYAEVGNDSQVDYHIRNTMRGIDLAHTAAARGYAHSCNEKMVEYHISKGGDRSQLVAAYAYNGNDKMAEHHISKGGNRGMAVLAFAKAGNDEMVEHHIKLGGSRGWAVYGYAMVARDDMVERHISKGGSRDEAVNGYVTVGNRAMVEHHRNILRKEKEAEERKARRKEAARQQRQTQPVPTPFAQPQAIFGNPFMQQGVNPFALQPLPDANPFLSNPFAPAQPKANEQNAQDQEMQRLIAEQNKRLSEFEKKLAQVEEKAEKNSAPTSPQPKRSHRASRRITSGDQAQISRLSPIPTGPQPAVKSIPSRRRAGTSIVLVEPRLMPQLDEESNEKHVQSIIAANEVRYAELNNKLVRIVGIGAEKLALATQLQKDQLALAEKNLNLQLDQIKQENQSLALLVKKADDSLAQHMLDTQKQTRGIYAEIFATQEALNPLLTKEQRAQELAATQDYLNGHQSKTVQIFYRVLTAELNGWLTVLEADGKILSPKSNMSDGAGAMAGAANAGSSIARGLGDVVGSSIPLAGGAVVLLGKMIEAGCNKYEAGKIHAGHRIVRQIPPAVGIRMISEEAARILALRFEDMIVNLKTEHDAKEFAEKIVKKMFFALREGKITLDDIKAGANLAEYLAMVISDFPMRNGDACVSLGNTELMSVSTFTQTKLDVTDARKKITGDRNITDEEIMRKSGLKKLNADGSVTYMCMKPANPKYEQEAKERAEKFGYRWATKRECENVCVIKTEPAKLNAVEKRAAAQIFAIDYVSKKHAKAEYKDAKQQAKAVGSPKPVIDRSHHRKSVATPLAPKTFEVNKKIGEVEVKNLITENEKLKQEQAEMKTQMAAMQAQMASLLKAQQQSQPSQGSFAAKHPKKLTGHSNRQSLQITSTQQNRLTVRQRTLADSDSGSRSSCD
jgi:hypothetical protein